MSRAMLEETAMAGGPRARRAWGSLLSAGALAGALSGLLAAALAGSGCGQRNLAVISLNDLPMSTKALTAYYRLDGGEWKTISPQRGFLQFGIELEESRSAKLETQVFGYADHLPCIHGSAMGEADMDGGSIRELSLQVNRTTQRCIGAAEPADFPQGKMLMLANAVDDIWLAGAGGKVVHWDGVSYSKVALPPELAQTPPDWNAIWSSGFEVWLAGSNGAVARSTRGLLSVVPILPTTPPKPTDWRSIGVADPGYGPLWVVGSNRVIGFNTIESPSITPVSLTCTGTNPTGDWTAVGCNAGVCYAVTDGGGIALLKLDNTLKASCVGFNTPKKPLSDVFIYADAVTKVVDVRAVGPGGVALRGSFPFTTTTGDPNLTAAGTDYSAFVPAGARVDFKRLNGTGPEDLWIVGQNGVLLRWQNGPFNMPSAASFAQSQTGVTAELNSISSINNGVFFSGVGKTFGYIGPLFTPN